MAACAGNETQQNHSFYNGWVHEQSVTNLIIFTPDGKIQSSYFNAPGVLHDSIMAIWSSIYIEIEIVYRDTGNEVVAVSKFASKKSNAILKSHQGNVDSKGITRRIFGINRQATSVRQFSEWGMQCLQGSFPRMKDNSLLQIEFPLQSLSGNVLLSFAATHSHLCDPIGR